MSNHTVIGSGLDQQAIPRAAYGVTIDGGEMAGAHGELLRRVEADLAKFAGRVGVDRGRWRGPVLDEQEAAGFLRAVDAGIATLEAGGVCRLTGLSAMARRKPYQLFSSYEGGAANPGPVLTWSWRELFTQVAFAAELVLDQWLAGSGSAA